MTGEYEEVILTDNLHKTLNIVRFEYIFYHKDKETRKKIEDKLRIKGINSSILQQAIGSSYDEGEVEQIELEQARKLLQKKHFNKENMDWKEQQKVYGFLLRKGIQSSIIKKAMMLEDVF